MATELIPGNNAKRYPGTSGRVQEFSDDGSVFKSGKKRTSDNTSVSGIDEASLHHKGFKNTTDLSNEELQKLIQVPRKPAAEELKANSGNAKWMELYNAEYKKQKAKFGEDKIKNLGQVYADEIIMASTIRQMKKNAAKQNELNKTILDGGANNALEVITRDYCVPNCTKNHYCFCLYDYRKNHTDPIEERPGEEFLKCGLDAKQTPINLESNMAITKSFKDDVFKFNYEVVDTRHSYKFNQTNESYWFPLQKIKVPENNLWDFNYMHTSTISLFDKHIDSCNFFAKQFHFHSPSEHSIDGKLMDLEMHIVHFIAKEHNPMKVDAKDPKRSQFFAGVLGFLFKVMPDSYFDDRVGENPNILFHDKFLQNLVDEEKLKQAKKTEEKILFDQDGGEVLEETDVKSPLNLARFVALIDYNRRFTYQGSLTTAPCTEGILWNVVEQVIPIR